MTVVVDLHAHVAMALTPPLRPAPGALRDRWRSALIGAAGRFGNRDPATGGPRVSLPLLRAGGVGVVGSVLYSYFDEAIWSPRWHAGQQLRRRGRRYHWAPASDRAFARLLRQLELVEAHVAADGAAVVVRDEPGLDAAVAAGRLAVVHAVEGAFHLGPDPARVDGRVAELVRRGVAYLTLGHLFHKGLASVAPSWATIGDARWNRIWPQPVPGGLTALGRAVLTACVRHGLAVDVTHLDARSLADTFALLDALDPQRAHPVLASHAVVRLGTMAYALTAQTIERIAERDGVIGLIASGPHLADGVGAGPRDGPGLLAHHAAQVARITGSDRHAAIGTDLGGFINAAPGLEHAGALARLDVPPSVAGENALRVLRAGLRAGRPA